MKKNYYWCGFINNRPHVCMHYDNFDSEKDYTYVELHRTKATAKVYYKDVRKVIIKEVKKNVPKRPKSQKRR